MDVLFTNQRTDKSLPLAGRQPVGWGEARTPTVVAHGCVVMSMDGRYFAKSQEGGAINEAKDGEDGMDIVAVCWGSCLTPTYSSAD